MTLVDRVEDEDLEAFLSAADVWLIPYRKNVAGVSVPSRFYNLLAIGRPVILVSEADAEAALTVTEHRYRLGCRARQAPTNLRRRSCLRLVGPKTRCVPNARPRSQGGSISPRPWPAIAGLIQRSSGVTPDEQLRPARPREAAHQSAPRRQPPMTMTMTSIAAECVMVEAIASTASSDIEREHLAHHAQHRKAVIGSALVKMRAMRRPEWLAPHHPAQQRHGRVGQIIQRQQQCGGELLMIGELQQTPAQQQPDRQAADISEKDFCHRAVEGRKPEHRAAQRRRDNGRRKPETSPSQPSTISAPVIGTTSATVIKSSPSMKLTRFTNQRPASNSRPRSIQSGQAGTIRRSPDAVKSMAATASALQQQPRQHRDGFDVVGKAYDGDEQRRSRIPRPGYSSGAAAA